ncbi:MAG: hypothetical protein CMM95_01065 [Rickettsiales bacterium]|nr:hypothetical protein [Rickettsiales bacterium]|tara:strand:- start:1674 stop:1982 length:309 start_codon:yes stop_codon:yes gene_type:complete
MPVEICSVNSQLDKLEEISNKISLLISSGDYEKINHLDRIRKKIIFDMQEKNFKLDDQNKQTVLKLISKNQQIVSEFKKKNKESLSKTLNSRKCAKAYLATL